MADPSPAAYAAQCELEGAVYPAHLSIDLNRLLAAINVGRASGVAEYRLQAATLKLNLARSAQTAATTLRKLMTVELLDVDCKELERGIAYAQDLSHRCEGLKARVDEASNFIERAREAQAATRRLDRVMSMAVTEVDPAALQEAVNAAKVTGVPSFKMERAWQHLHAAPKAQAAVQALKDALKPETSAMDLSLVRHCLSAAKTMGAELPTDIIEAAQSDLNEAATQQAEDELAALLGPNGELLYEVPGAVANGAPFSALSVPLERLAAAIEAAKLARLPAPQIDGAAAMLVVATEAQEAMGFAESAVMREALAVDLGAAQRAHERAERAGVPAEEPRMAHVSKLLSEARQMQQAHKSLVGAMQLEEGIEAVIVLELHEAIQRAAAASVPRDVLVRAEKRLVRATSLQQAWAELNDAASGGILDVGVRRLRRALDAAMTAGVPGEPINAAQARLDEASEAQKANGYLILSMSVNVLQVKRDKLLRAIQEAKEARVPEAQIARAEAFLGDCHAAQAAVTAVDRECEPAPYQVDTTKLQQCLDTARAAGVPNARLKFAEVRLRDALHAQKCGRALKAAMSQELFSNVDMDVRRRREALERALADARDSGVPMWLIASAATKLETTAVARKALFCLQSMMDSIVHNRAVDLAKMREAIEECKAGGMKVQRVSLLLKATRKLEEAEAKEAERQARREVERTERLERMAAVRRRSEQSAALKLTIVMVVTTA